ncbi:MAG: AAA family ATPase [Anaerolinea sp.]|nr:AAA family ATPase [Anaerolinea sp.]
MLSAHILTDLLVLIRQRYPDWEDFAHPGFVAAEILYKQAAAAKAQEMLGKAELDRLLGAGEVDECLARLERAAHDNNLLWRRVPAAGDTAVLHHPNLDKATFCVQVRNLLYGDRSSAERLGSFSAYLAANDLPNGWPLPTYFLFLLHPDTDIFVKPRAAQWFLRYMGETAVTITTPPTAALYQLVQQYAHSLREALTPFGARDMLDVQSFIWVCFRAGSAATGRLDSKAQVDLDVPRTEPAEPAAWAETAVIRERPTPYDAATAPNPAITLPALAQETGYTTEALARWVQAIARKQQAVFYGPPGTGKTFIAQKMAAYLAGGGDGLVELVQFHPAYAYEDFMQGIRPAIEGGEVRYEMQNGRFLTFCQRAQSCQGPSVFIIDELNRANIATVFGELMYLLEYRDHAIPLAGGGRFAIPPNVRILATMNTADRSIALVDHALRRRFAFIHLAPNFDALRHYHRQTGFDSHGLITVLRDLNTQIGDPHYHIGHSFFMQANVAAQLADIWQMEIEPYLEEYFFNQPDRIAPWRWPQVAARIIAA